MVRVDVGTVAVLWSLASGFQANRDSCRVMSWISCWKFQASQRKVDAFHHVLRDVIAHTFVVSALFELLASMSLVLGPVVCLWTRSLYYRDILRAILWDSPYQLSADAQGEVVFWEKNICNTGRTVWSCSPKPKVLTYSDGSDSGWSRFAVQVGGQEAVGSWSVDESNKSSTFREMCLLLPC